MLANSRLPRRGGGPGSKQDVMTELDRGSLPAPTTTFGKRPWDYKGSDKAHLSYFTVGNIYAHSPGFPSRTWPSPLSQRKEDKLYDFQGHYAISGGDHVVSVNMFLVSSFPLLLIISLPLFLSHPSSSSSPSITNITKRIHGHCGDFGKHRRIQGSKSNPLKIHHPKNPTTSVPLIVLGNLFSFIYS